jgi:hypothetical protein
MKTIYTLLAAFLISTNVFALELLDFKATSFPDGHIICEWSSVNESNTDSYTVEISSNAIEYNDFANVKSKGNSAGQYYSIMNQVTFTGIRYLRIKHTDFDGNIQYSKIVSISNDQTDSEINIYPNPSSGETINLQINTKRENLNHTLKLIGRSGRIIYESPLNSSESNYQFDLEKGYYFVWLVEENGNVLTKKIVVD